MFFIPFFNISDLTRNDHPVKLFPHREKDFISLADIARHSETTLAEMQLDAQQAARS